MEIDNSKYSNLLKKITSLREETSIEGWDYDNGVIISSDVWDEIIIFIEKISLKIDPFISACGDGFAHISCRAVAPQEPAHELRFAV